jgi:hypothetical protein
MSSRHAVPWWRPGVGVLALMLFPVLAAAALAAFFAGLFTAAAGVINARDIGILAAGLVALGLAFALGRLAGWAVQERKAFLRSQRMALGLALIIGGALAMALTAAMPIWGTVAAIGAGAYAVFGVMLIVDAKGDRWSP